MVAHLAGGPAGRGDGWEDGKEKKKKSLPTFTFRKAAKVQGKNQIF
jgi:hypothetical protein